MPPRLAIAGLILLGLARAADFAPPRTLQSLSGGLEENRGQADPTVRFLWRGDSGNAGFTSNGVGYNRGGIRVEFPGAGVNSRSRGADPLPLSVNIIRGADPAKWLLKIPHYRSAVIEDLYPGIDLTWQPSGDASLRRLNWTAVVKPGAEPGALRLQITGFESAPFAGPGGLWFSGPLPVFIVYGPTAWQMKNGSRVAVTVRQRHTSGGAIEFDWEPHDRSLPLYVAGGIGPFPAPAYASLSGTQLAGDGRLAWVRAGITPGEASETPCNSGPGSSRGNCYDLWAARWNEQGEPQWLTILGGAAEESLHHLRFFPSGDPLLAGQTFSEDFPVTANAAQIRYGGPRYPSEVEAYGGDLFLARLSAETGTLLASTYYGDESPDTPRALAVDPAGAAYIASGKVLVKWDAAANRFAYAAVLGAEPRALAASAQGETWYLGPAGPGLLTLGRLAPDGTRNTFQADLPIPGAGDGEQLIQASLSADSRGNAWAASWVGDPQAARARTLLTRVDGNAARVAFHAYTGARQTNWPALQVDAADHAVLVENVAAGFAPVTTGAIQTSPCGGQYRSPGVYLARWAPDGQLAFASYLPGFAPMLDGRGTPWRQDYDGAGRMTLSPLDWLAETPVRLLCKPYSISPGQTVSFIGGGFGPAQPAPAVRDADGRLPVALAGAQVRIGGLPAPLLEVARGRIVAQVPYGFLTGPARVEIEIDGRPLDAFDAAVSAYLFRFYASAGGDGRQALALNQDGGVNSPAHPAAPGSIVSLFGEGAGALAPAVREGGLHSLTELSYSNQPVRAWLRAPDASYIALDVTYFGSAPGLPTYVTQVNLRLPEHLPAEYRRPDAGVSIYLGTPPRYFIYPEPQVAISIQ